MAPPSRHDFPAELHEFAKTLRGTYEERYPEILDHAFLEHKLVLNALNLKMIAGGGSHAVAQAAVDSWRSRLHALLAQRVDIGAELPEELKARFSAALIDLWTLSRKHASSDFEAREIVLRNEASEAEDRAKDLRERLEAEVDLSKKVHAQLEDARAISRSMQEEISRLQADHQRARNDLELERAERQAAANSAAQTIEDLRARLAQAEASLTEQVRVATEERESMRRQHMLELDRTRTELRKEIQAGRDSAAKLTDALTRSAAEMVNLRTGQQAELNEVRAQYRQELNSAQAAAQVAEATSKAEMRRLQEAHEGSVRERDLLQAALARESAMANDAAQKIGELELLLKEIRSTAQGGHVADTGPGGLSDVKTPTKSRSRG